MIPVAPLPADTPSATRPDRDATLRQKARELEGVFLAEMLRHAGVAKLPESFGGGAGEEQFASFLREAQARAIVKKGGIGLAEHLFHALKARENDSR
ncbi:MAG: rod-binding protein [Gemmobacter sp.]|uniref:rod-binding protein n=1 Tax=Gemmobacter sp. TaxID=1898957 RepID=UPI00391CB338